MGSPAPAAAPARARRGLRFPLRLKFFALTAVVAIAPLIAVGDNLMRIARDELKSATNQALAEAAGQVVERIDATVSGVWLRPIALVGAAVDDPALDVRQKAEILNLAVREIPGVAAIQLTVEGAPLPIVAVAEAFATELRAAGRDPVGVLRTPPETLERIAAAGAPVAERFPEFDRWFATVATPLRSTLSGRKLTLSARIDLALLARIAAAQPLGRRGELNVVDAKGAAVLRPGPDGLAERAIVAQAAGLIGGAARAAVVQNYTRADGETVLGAFALADSFPWAVVAEQTEASAYAVIAQMTRSLALWVTLGFLVAAAAALFASWRLSGPILEIGETARRIGEGDFAARVRPRSRDEIGDLAERLNVMAGQISERFELMKFVSRETVRAVSGAGAEGVRLGGERRAAAMLFSDIRGYTAFAETREPEIVIEMLNLYLETQARLVVEHGGDVDKFIADAVVAVFLGEDRARNAAACALAIQNAMRALLERHPAWDLHVGLGLSEGDVVMGAMGARDRMDFTVLGDAVNLASRLCSVAPADAILVSERIAEGVRAHPEFRLEALPPIALKGMARPVPAFRLTEAASAPAAAG